MHPHHRTIVSDRLRAAVALVLTVIALSVVPADGRAVASGRDTGDPSGRVSTTWGLSPSAEDGRDTRSAIDLVVDPGTTVVEHVVVDNYGDEPIIVDLYAADARPADGEFDVAAADESRTGVGAWARPARPRVEIPGRDHVIVSVTFTVPPDATPGDHAGGILASRRQPGAGASTGFETERRVGTRVHLRVAGAVAPSIDVSDLSVVHHQRLTPMAGGDLDVSFRITNTGNLRLGTAARVEVRGIGGIGSRSAALVGPDDLLPGHSVHLHHTLTGVRPTGPLDVEVRLEARTSAGQPLSGGAVQPAVASQRLWAVPVSTLVLVAAVGGTLWRARRSRRRRRRDSPDDDDAPHPAAASPPHGA